MKLTGSIMVIPIAALLMTGCATPQRSEYAAFAQAGAGYAQAVDKVLIAAGQAQVDEGSWTLVSEKHKVGRGDSTTYDKRTKEDKELLEVFQRLRNHAAVLADYFGHLESLATSDTPTRTENAIKWTVDQISNLSATLRASFPEVPALPKFGQLAAELKIRAALKKELETRKDVIRNELYLQENLLILVRARMSSQLIFIKETKERQIVRLPFTDKSPLIKPEEWVASRREVIYLPTTAAEVDSAFKVAEKMRQTFDRLLSGEKDTIDAINALLIDIENILDVADLFK